MSIPPFPANDRPFFGALQDMRESLAPYLPALAWFDFDAGIAPTNPTHVATGSL